MLSDVLTPELVTTDLGGADKRSIIESLLELIAGSGAVADPAAALRDLLAHEAETSTGMENGIAIPHAKTDAVDHLVACIGVSRKPVEFECLDRKPARIFVMTLSPRNAGGPHIRFLADVARILKNDAIRKQMLEAQSDEELFRIVTAPAG